MLLLFSLWFFSPWRPTSLGVEVCHLVAFFQSSLKRCIPLSVKGCLIIALSIFGGMVAMCVPISAACMTWIGWRMLAAITWVL